MGLAEHLKKAIAASLDAGAAILRIYARDFSVETKADFSPLTAEFSAEQSVDAIIAKLRVDGIIG